MLSFSPLAESSAYHFVSDLDQHHRIVQTLERESLVPDQERDRMRVR